MTKVHLLRRISASVIDYFLLWIPLSLILIGFLTNEEHQLPTLTMVLFLIGVPAIGETVLLDLFATTLGKWVLGLRLVCKSASSASVGSLLKRSAIKSCFAIVPIIGILAASRSLAKTRSTWWDDAASTTVSFEQTSSVQKALALVLVFPVLLSYGTIKHLTKIEGKIDAVQVKHLPEPAQITPSDLFKNLPDARQVSSPADIFGSTEYVVESYE